VPRAAVHNALYDKLSRLGFVEGQNLQTDGQGYGLRPEQFRQDAAELAKDKLDVIVCVGAAAIRAAQQATATIPILGITDDMVGEGFVRSMAHPAAIRPGSASSPPNSTVSGRNS
jgi:putative ABC transport system substrate-binding protein